MTGTKATDAKGRNTKLSGSSEPAPQLGRRAFLGGVSLGVAGATIAQGPGGTSPAAAQTAPPAAAAQPAGYTFLKPAEALFVEALVDHMVPKDELTASGTDLGIATFIDRALAGSWGKGDRLYMSGPWLPRHAQPGLPAATFTRRTLSRGDRRL